MAYTQQGNYTGPTLFPATNPSLSQTVKAQTPATSELWKTLMEQLNKVNQDNKLLKGVYKKKSQQNQGFNPKLPNKIRHQQLQASPQQKIQVQNQLR